jgi:putative hydrolase of the HAD superfamily
LNRAGLIGYFDHLVISCEVGCKKPDARIFNLALAKAGVNGRECLYVGDNYYDDALGSRKVGMQSLIINRFGLLGVEEITDCPIIKDISEIFDYLTPAEKKRRDSPAGA